MRISYFGAALPLAFLALFWGCGTSDSQLSISMSSADATTLRGNASVSDVVLVAQNLPVSGRFLDENGDNQPDLFVFPASCGAARPAGCGSPTPFAQSLEFGSLPSGFSYLLRLEFRDASGVILFHTEDTLSTTPGEVVSLTPSLETGA